MHSKERFFHWLATALVLLAGPGLYSLATANAFETPYSVAYLRLTGGTLTGGISVSGTATCTGTDSVIYDNNGVAGCQKLSDVAPQGTMFRAQPAFAGGTQTASTALICGGQDETLVAIDGADPSVSCAGANDTVTVTVIDSNGASTATILTGDVDWVVSASVAATCATLAAAIDALAGVGASCTSPNVRITLDKNTCKVTLAESTAACTTVSVGTRGPVRTPDNFVMGTNNALILDGLSAATGDYITCTAAGNCRWSVGGAVQLIYSSTLFTMGLPISIGSTLVGTSTSNIGWSVQAVANQACNTTCTSACVVGEDTSVLGTFVDCADATADRCICAGAS